MEHNVNELREALTARSHTATLEELQSRGKRQVRVIRADDVASMIEAAVSDAIANSDLMSPEEVEDLVAKSRQQFQSMMERRQAEVAELRQAAHELETCREELARVKREQVDVLADRQRLRGQLEDAGTRIETLQADVAKSTAAAELAVTKELADSQAATERLRTELDAASRRIDELRSQMVKAGEQASASDAAARELVASQAERQRLQAELTAARQQLEALRHEVATANERAKLAATATQDLAASQAMQLRLRGELDAALAQLEVSRGDAAKAVAAAEAKVAQELAASQAELARIKREQLDSLNEQQRLQTTLDAMEQRAKQAEEALAAAQASAQVAAPTGVPPELVYRLMGELADLKARASAPAAAPAPGAGAADALTGAIQQLTNTFTAKLETLSRKMGVSSAVQSDAPNLAALFKHDDSKKLESNLDNVTVKAKSATGIAANLERLKKLKGGG